MKIRRCNEMEYITEYGLEIAEAIEEYYTREDD